MDLHTKIAASLRLSSHILDERPCELPGQLQSRLLYDEQADSRELLGSIDRNTSWPWAQSVVSNHLSPISGTLQTLWGCSSSISALAVSEDCDLVAAGTTHGEIRTWILGSGRCTSVIDCEHGQIDSLAISPEYRFVVAAMGGVRSYTIQAWNFESGNSIGKWKLGPHRQLDDDEYFQAWVLGVVDNGAAVIVDSTEGDVFKWEPIARTLSRVVGSNGERSASPAICPSNNLAIASQPNGILCVFDIRSGTLKFSLSGHHGFVHNLDWATDGRHVVSFGTDGTTRFWDVERQFCIRLIRADGTEEVFDPEPTANGVLASGIRGETRVSELRVLEAATGKRWEVSLPYPACEVVLAPGGEFAVCGEDGGAVRLVDVRPETVAANTEGPRKRPALLSRSSKIALTGHRAVLILQNRTRIWHLDDWHYGEDTRLRKLHAYEVTASHSGRFAAAIGKPVADENEWQITKEWQETNHQILIWNLDSGQTFLIDTDINSRPIGLALCDISSRVLACFADGEIICWNYESGMDLWRIQVHSEKLLAFCAKADLSTIAVAGSDNSVRAWSIFDSVESRLAQSHSTGIVGVAIGNTNPIVVSHLSGKSSDSDNKESCYKVCVREFDACENRLEIRGSPGVITAFTLMPNDTHAVVAADKTLEVWNLQSGELVSSTPDFRGSISDIIPDSPQTFVLSSDQSLMQFDVYTGEMLRVASFDHRVSRIWHLADDHWLVEERSGSFSVVRFA